MKMLLSALLSVAIVAACATTDTVDQTAMISIDPIEGYWKLSDQETILSIERCAHGSGSHCGILVVFEGDKDDRKYLTADFISWGQRKCRSTILQIDADPQRPDRYLGAIESQTDGQTYTIELTLRMNGIIDAHTFLSADLEEAVDMAVGAALGDSPSIIDAGSFLARAVAGKELHSEVERWTRVASPSSRCDRPSIKPHKGKTE